MIIRLLIVDFRKYFYNKTFWILLAMYLGLLVVSFFTVEALLNNIVTEASGDSPVPIPGFSLYEFPLVWHNLTYLGGFFKIILALLVIVAVTNEFTYQTIRQNIMSGMSRSDFIWSKMLFVFTLCLLSTLLLFISGSLLGLMFSTEISAALFFEKIQFIPAYFLELLTFCSMAFLVAFLVKRTGLAIALLAFYYYILENAIAFLLPDTISRYLPVTAISNMIDIPNSALMSLFGINFRDFVSIPDATTCLIYCLIFTGIVFLMMPGKDL